MKDFREPLAEAAESTVKDAVSQMEREPGYRFVKERIEQAIKHLQADLERPTDSIQTSLTRGELKGLRTALAVPDILKREAGGEWASKKVKNK
jgi:hypothetical protein